MDDTHSKIVIDRVKSLPTLPQIFYRIIELVESRESSAEDLEKLVLQDQSISAKILKVANSAAYSSGKACSDIHQAIVRIGFEALKSISLSISIFKFTPGSSSAAVFSREELWRHSIGAAEAARMAARLIKYPNLDEAYLAGLLHDIGKVILDFYFPREYAQVGNYIKKNKCSIREAETQILGFDHAAVGSWLAEQWKFPESIRASIEYHHRLREVSSEFSVQTALAHIGNYVVKKAGFGSGGDELTPDFAKQIFLLKNFTDESPDLLFKKFQEKRDNIEEMCKIIY